MEESFENHTWSLNVSSYIREILFIHINFNVFWRTFIQILQLPGKIPDHLRSQINILVGCLCVKRNNVVRASNLLCPSVIWLQDSSILSGGNDRMANHITESLDPERANTKTLTDWEIHYHGWFYHRCSQRLLNINLGKFRERALLANS